MHSDYTTIRVSAADGIGHIMLDRPRALNAFNAALMAEVTTALRAFEAVARHLSFTRAAEELGMTQAAVSYQIRMLEERMGAPLFLRKPREVVLTETGALFARPTVDAFEILREAYADPSADSVSTLSISTVPTFAGAVWNTLKPVSPGVK